MTSDVKKDKLVFDNELADCVFVIDDEEITADKMLLTYNSPVFEKMFYGKMASSRVVITDINLEDFNQMLQYIYTDKVQINSVLHAWSLFYIAHKYLLNNFANVLVNYIQRNLCLNNLLLNYEYAEMYAIPKLERVCMNEISVFVRGIFQKSVCDYHMKPSTIGRILNQRFLNISNNELITQVLLWAVTECDINDIRPSPTNIVHLLQSLNILQYLVDLLDVNSIVINDLLLLNTCKLISRMKHEEIPLRHYLEKHWCTFCLCRHTYKIAGRVDLRPRDVLISNISVNRKVVLFGVVVTTEVEQIGSQPCSYNGAIEIEILHDDKILVVTHFSDTFLYETPVYIPLSNLIYLNSNKDYKIRIRYTNFDNLKESCNKTSSVLCNYMTCDLKDEKQDTVFSFDEINGSVIRGLCYYPF